jgi:hypothetical protein
MMAHVPECCLVGVDLADVLAEARRGAVGWAFSPETRLGRPGVVTKYDGACQVCGGSSWGRAYYEACLNCGGTGHESWEAWGSDEARERFGRGFASMVQT